MLRPHLSSRQCIAPPQSYLQSCFRIFIIYSIALKELLMRIHEGDFAYDLEQPRDPLTQLALKWRYRIFRVRPVEELVASGEADSKEEAEKKARSAISGLRRKKVA
jgi:hypothetical protein